MKKCISNILLVFSGLSLTFILTLNFSVKIVYEGYTAMDYSVMPIYAIIAVGISLLIYVFFLRKTDLINRSIANATRLSYIVSVSLTFFTSLQIILDCQKNYTHILSSCPRFFLDEVLNGYTYKGGLLLLSLLSSIALFFIVLYTSNMLIPFFQEFFSEVDKIEKYYFVAATIACCSLIMFFFTKSSAPWASLDLVYQTDTIFVTEHYYPVFSYGFDFDWDIGNGGIRHPIATLLTYPIYVVCSILAILLSYIPNIQPILYAIFQSEMLIFTAIVLKRITKSGWTLLLFSLSFPFVFFTIFIEKYQISVLLMVLFVYCVSRYKSTSLQKYFLFASSGMMLTSVVYGFFYGKERSFWKRIREYVSVAFAFLAVLVASGRIGYILNFTYLRTHNFEMFVDGGNEVHTLFNKFCGFTNLLTSSFIPVEYQVNELNFYWTDLVSNPNWLGLFILVLLITIVIINVKNRTVWLLFLWTAYSAVQELILGIGPGCDPLFSLYFTWPVISLVVIGINSVFKKYWSRALVYVPLFIVMFYLNVQHLVVLLNYITDKCPI